MATGPRPITVLVVDDEPPARTGLVRLLAGHPEFTVVGACGDGTAAIRACGSASTSGRIPARRG